MHCPKCLCIFPWVRLTCSQSVLHKAGPFSLLQPVGLCPCWQDVCWYMGLLQSAMTFAAHWLFKCNYGPLLASCSIDASSFLSLTLPVLFPSCVVFFLLQTEFQFTCSSCFSQSQDCESVVTGFTITGCRELTACFCIHTWDYLWISAKIPTLLSQMPLPEDGKRSKGGRSWQEIHLSKASHARHCVLL